MTHSRRDFIRDASALALAAWAARRIPSSTGLRLAAHPHPPHRTVASGLTSLGIARPRDTELYVPTSYRANRPAALILALHGATQDSDFTLRVLQSAAESAGCLLLAPNSLGVTWDLMHDDSGLDEQLMDKALDWTFDHCNVDPSRVILAGFSDGATAALSLGLANGDLFKRVVAFSPGFIIGTERHGKPPIFISHGTRDQILPIEQTSYRLVPRLQREGYAVTFKTFDGPHRVPPEIVAEMITWLNTEPGARQPLQLTARARAESWRG